MDDLPLAGIRVLDLSRVLAGPFCCTLLGEVGADVIKVERPIVGDENRHWGSPWHGESLNHMSVNRNKRCITVDFKTESGREIVRKLVAWADILVESFTPGTLEEYELGYEHLAKDHPKLIYCSISGFGDRGPMRDQPGYDGVLQAFTGHMSITGEAAGGPVRTGASIIDMSTGITAYGAVMTALVGRGRSGLGQKVSVSLLQTAVAELGSLAVASLMLEEEPVRAGSGVAHLAPYGAFRTRDGYVATGALNDQSWVRFCSAIQRPDLLEDPRYGSGADRVANREMLEATLHGVFVERTMAEWIEIFDRAGVPIAPVNTLNDVMRHEQVRANGMVVTTEHPTGGALHLVGAPMDFSRWDLGPTRPPALLGQHTDELLGEFGYSPDEIVALRASGAV